MTKMSLELSLFILYIFGGLVKLLKSYGNLIEVAKKIIIFFTHEKVEDNVLIVL